MVDGDLVRLGLRGCAGGMVQSSQVELFENAAGRRHERHRLDNDCVFVLGR